MIRRATLHFAVALNLIAGVNFAAPTATYYVATNGSDTSGNGTEGSPWATITHGLDNAEDGSLILVKPGVYTGRMRIRGEFAAGVTVRSELPYQARLRHNAAVLTIYDGIGITIEAFDISHDGPGAGALVVQIQDLIDEPGGANRTSRITLRNNILHDSYNNDILKINNGASDILVEGNVFYNQTGSDEHIDINSVERVEVRDNIFLNDFASSGRTNDNSTSSYIVIKDSNGNDDGITGSSDIYVHRNVFLNWEGSTGSNFLLVGEDGTPTFEADGVIAENNLMIGNSANVMRSAFSVKGSRDVTFRNNTVVGDLPSLAFAFRVVAEGENQPSENINLYNNIWCDNTGTMGAESAGGNNDFSDGDPADLASFEILRNVYWNGGSPIPSNNAEAVNYTDDPTAIVENPLLPAQSNVALPTWNPNTGNFRDGSSTIREAFVRLVNLYGTPGEGSAAVDAANPANAPSDDILGNPRGGTPDIGAVERQGGPAMSEAFILY